MSVAPPVIPGLTLTFVLIAASAIAQAVPPLPSRAFAGPAPTVFAESPAQQLIDLARWSRDYQAWKAWFLKWRGVREPGWWGTRDRRQPPEPPAWLPDACATPIDDTGPIAGACREWRELTSGDEAASLLTQQTAQARSQLESPTHTAWWEHVHVDALWPMTQTGSSAFGLAGMHTTMNVTGRFQVFVAPGVLVMRVPSLTGEMTWSAATDWGFSYRLFDFVMPGTRRPSAVHFNMVRVWVLGGTVMRLPGEMYLAGFSLTFKQR